MLDLPGAQIERSNAFVLSKAGLTLDHLASFLKDWNLLKQLFDATNKFKEPGFDENEIKMMLKEIPPWKAFEFMSVTSLGKIISPQTTWNYKQA